MLALQVAAGILLAYVIIVNQSFVLKSLKWLLTAITALLIVGCLIWAISSAADSVSPYISPVWSKILMIIGVLPILAILGFGGYGFWVLSYRVVGKQPKEIGEGTLAATSMLNFMLVGLVAWPISSYTFLGEWYAAIDQWSRNSGFEDGFSFAFMALFSLWPYLPLWFINRRNKNSVEAKAEGDPA
jgi:hypothetical protein